MLDIQMNINPEGIEKSIGELQNKLNKAFSGKGFANLDTQAKQTAVQLNDVVSKLAQVTQKMKELENQKIPTEEYTAVQKQITETQAKLVKLQEHFDKMKEIGKPLEGVQLKKFQYEVAELTNTLDYAKGELKDLEDTGKAFTMGNTTPEFQKLATQQRDLYNSSIALQEKLGKSTGIFDTFGDKLRKLGGSAVKGVTTGLKSIGSAALNAGKRIASAFGNKVKGLFSKLGQSAKNAGKHIGSAFSLKKLALFAVGLRSVMAAFNKLRGSIVEGVNNLARFNGGNNETNKNLSMLTSSLAQLKNSLGTAFAPILNFIAPALNTLIQLLNSATTALGMFFAKMTGQSTFTKAVAVQKDYAKSLDKTGSSASKAQDKLAAFDDLQVLNPDKGDQGGGGGGETSPEQMFQEVPIDTGVSDWADKFKQSWEDADFTEIGAILGAKLRDALDSIPWGAIQDGARKIAKSIGTFINGFIGTEGLAESIGRTLGEAINTAFIFLYDLITTIDWYAIGDFIGTAIMEGFNTIDWDLLGATFAEGINAITDTLQGFADVFDPEIVSNDLSDGLNSAINNIDWTGAGKALSDTLIDLMQAALKTIEKVNWQQLGKDVAAFIGAIDWSGLSDALFEGIGAVLGGLAGFLWGLIEGAWNDVVAWWYDVAYEDGQFTIGGLLEGIWNVMCDIGQWIWEHIFQPFIDGFKKAFGIASPSTVMEEQGDFIMEGLLQGITSKVASIIEKFTRIKEDILEIFTAIKSKVTSLVTDTKEKVISTVQALWDGIKKPLNAILGGIETVCNGIINGINHAIDALNSLSFDVPDWVPGIGGGTFGFNIPKLSNVTLPRLAEGAVIPPNKEFTAVLGDQTSGTNIETPLETMIEAFRTAMADMPTQSATGAVMELDGQTFAQLIVPYVMNEFNRQGYDVNVITGG